MSDSQLNYIDSQIKVEASTIIFNIKQKKATGFKVIEFEKEYIKITEEGFFVDGERIEDKYDVYTRFNDFLNHIK
jgi:hypothetical protein